jgi:hypothetical protein
MPKLNSKKTISTIIIAVIAVSILSVWLLYPKEAKPTSFSDDFENGLGNWTKNAQVPEDPNNPGHSVAWTIERVTNQSISGNYSVLFTIDGSQDDGAIWMQHRLSFEPNAVKTVTVTIQLWSPSESFNTIAAVIGYAGRIEPTVEGDFKIIGAANQAKGWKTYAFTAEVTADSNGTAYTALGIAVRWETTLAYYIDDVHVTVN